MIDIKDFTWSYSAITSYETCPYGFKSIYLDKEPTISNFFAQYGIIVHKVLEDYFNEKIDIWDMCNTFKEYIETLMTVKPPPYPTNMYDTYINEGICFFSNFSLDRDDYVVINIEKKISEKFMHTSLSIRPDLVLKHKKTGKISLVDYKTSKYKGKLSIENSKVVAYKKQFLLYAYYLWLHNIKVDTIQIWFIRNNDCIEFNVNTKDVMENIQWAEGIAKKALEDKTWKPTDFENNYFCKFICGYRNSCKYLNATESEEDFILY